MNFSYWGVHIISWRFRGRSIRTKSPQTRHHTHTQRCRKRPFISLFATTGIKARCDCCYGPSSCTIGTWCCFLCVETMVTRTKATEIAATLWHRRLASVHCVLMLDISGTRDLAAATKQIDWGQAPSFVVCGNTNNPHPKKKKKERRKSSISTVTEMKREEHWILLFGWHLVESRIEAYLLWALTNT